MTVPTQETYREANRRTHKLLGIYLALWAWTHKVDCVVLDRYSLMPFLGLEKNMQSRRTYRFWEDLRYLFPHREVLRFSNDTFACIFLSRVAFPPRAFTGTMSDDRRIQSLLNVGVRAAKVSVPPEEDIIAMLGPVILGIKDFPHEADAA